MEDYTMENKMTVKDILIDVNKLLNEINIPVAQVESIGIPVARAINGIQLCIDAINMQEAQKEKTQSEVAEDVRADSAAEGENDA